MNERNIHPENFLIAVRYQSGHSLRSRALWQESSFYRGGDPICKSRDVPNHTSATVSYVSNELLRDGMLSLWPHANASPTLDDGMRAEISAMNILTANLVFSISCSGLPPESISYQDSMI